jgi:hypothetical protein
MQSGETKTKSGKNPERVQYEKQQQKKVTEKSRDVANVE